MYVLAGAAMEDLLKVSGLSLHLPPELRSLCPDMLPQLVLSYEHAEQVRWTIGIIPL